MTVVGGPPAIPPMHGRMAQESAALLANLVKALGAGKELAEPLDIRSLKLDPAALSALVRRAGLEQHLAASEAEQQDHLVLQDVLGRVSPQHLTKLLAVLQKSEQPAVNHDQTYGEAASFGDPGSSRPANRADPVFRELWAHGASGQHATGHAKPEVTEAGESWHPYAQERAGWQHSYAPQPASPDLLPSIIWHPAFVAALLVFALLSVGLLGLSYA